MQEIEERSAAAGMTVRTEMMMRSRGLPRSPRGSPGWPSSTSSSSGDWSREMAPGRPKKPAIWAASQALQRGARLHLKHHLRESEVCLQHFLEGLQSEVQDLGFGECGQEVLKSWAHDNDDVTLLVPPSHPERRRRIQNTSIGPGLRTPTSPIYNMTYSQRSVFLVAYWDCEHSCPMIAEHYGQPFGAKAAVVNFNRLAGALGPILSAHDVRQMEKMWEETEAQLKDWMTSHTNPTQWMLRLWLSMHPGAVPAFSLPYIMVHFMFCIWRNHVIIMDSVIIVIVIIRIISSCLSIGSKMI